MDTAPFVNGSMARHDLKRATDIVLDIKSSMDVQFDEIGKEKYDRTILYEALDDLNAVLDAGKAKVAALQLKMGKEPGDDADGCRFYDEVRRQYEWYDPIQQAPKFGRLGINDLFAPIDSMHNKIRHLHQAMVDAAWLHHAIGTNIDIQVFNAAPGTYMDKIKSIARKGEYMMSTKPSKRDGVRYNYMLSLAKWIERCYKDETLHIGYKPTFVPVSMSSCGKAKKKANTN